MSTAILFFMLCVLLQLNALLEYQIMEANIVLLMAYEKNPCFLSVASERGYGGLK